MTIVLEEGTAEEGKSTGIMVPRSTPATAVVSEVVIVVVLVGSVRPIVVVTIAFGLPPSMSGILSFGVLTTLPNVTSSFAKRRRLQSS